MLGKPKTVVLILALPHRRKLPTLYPLHFLDRKQAQFIVSPYLKKQISGPTRCPTEDFCWDQNEK